MTTIETNRKYMAEACITNPENIKTLDAKLLNNKLFVRKVAKKVPEIMKYMSERLKSDIEFVTSLCKTNDTSINYINEDLQKDENFIISCLQKYYECKNQEVNYDVKPQFHSKLRYNAEFIYKMNKLNKYFNVKFSELFDEVDSNKEIMLELAKKDITLLKYADKDLLSCENFIKSAYNINNKALAYVDKRIITDEFILRL